MRTRSTNNRNKLVDDTDRGAYTPWSIVTVVAVELPVAVATLGTVFISPLLHIRVKTEYTQ